MYELRSFRNALLRWSRLRVAAGLPTYDETRRDVEQATSFRARMIGRAPGFGL